MSDELLDEYLKLMDEMKDFMDTHPGKFHVLAERMESRAERIKLKDLSRIFPLDTIRYQQLDKLNRDSQYIEVEGEFFPDYIEEAGLHFVSIRFLQYLKEKVMLGDSEYNLVGLMGEGRKRVEPYCLLIPPELDCIAPGTARYDKNGTLVYFEIDPQKVDEFNVFKVKGFPHLIVVNKLNKLEYAGYRCMRIENFFDYEGCRERDYQERLSGRAWEQAAKEYQTKASAPAHIYFRERLLKLCNREKIQNQMQAGIKLILDSFQGSVFGAERLCERYLRFYWSEQPCRIRLAPERAERFVTVEFGVEALQEALEYQRKLPAELQSAGERLIRETLGYCLSRACKAFESYEAVHENQRFKLYMEPEGMNGPNPWLLYDFKSAWQLSVEGAKDLRKVDLTGKDLREFDFSGKDLTGVRFDDANLRRTRFRGSILDKAVFVNCNLTGTEFGQASLRGAQFIDCKFDRTNFDAAILCGAEFSGSMLIQCSFIKSDLTRARIRNQHLVKSYFYKARLSGAKFEFTGSMFDNGFILADLHDARFIGNSYEPRNVLGDCHFHNANLTGAVFEVHRMVDNIFTKAKLNSANLSGSRKLVRCDLRWAECFKLELGRLYVKKCDFSFVDFSKLKEMTRAIFAENYFFHTKLSGYDFSDPGYYCPNDFVYTDLTGCNLAGFDLSDSKVIYVNFKDAQLNGARFSKKQLPFVGLSAKQGREIELIGERGDEDAGA